MVDDLILEIFPARHNPSNAIVRIRAGSSTEFSILQDNQGNSACRCLHDHYTRIDKV